tara:strand:- start:1018 stop:2043 length:1026 start_codon:yes stop_codon:yes gene_type:complete
MLWLEKKYLNIASVYLDRAKWINDDTFNHRCPYCGDSQKNLYKARGYHFVKEQSYIYKCHNCSKSTSSVQFLKDNYPSIHKEYLKEYLKEQGVKPKSKKMPDSSHFKFTPRTDFLNKKDDSLKAVAYTAGEKEVSRQYLRSRRIPEFQWKDIWFVENAQALHLLSDKYKDRVLGNDPRIILPFYDENGKLTGVTGRAINDSPLRYLTLRFRDDVPLIFNYNNVDRTKTIYVTEGPIDSLFLPNSIAVAGSDFKKISEDIKENAILIYDNEPRNKEIIKKIEEVIDLGYRVCIWNDKRIKDCKDINDMVMSGLSEIEVIDIINRNTVQGLSARLQLMEFKKV